MSNPTPQQIAAMKRIKIELNKLCTYTQRINELIDGNFLEADHGIYRLPYFPMYQTTGAIDETIRRHELMQSQKAREA